MITFYSALSRSIAAMEKIEPVKVLYREDVLNIENKGTTTNTRSNTVSLAYSGKLPDILAYLQRETNLTRRTIVNILKSSGRLGEFAINPQRFMDEVVKCIQHELHRLMMSGIVYEKLPAWFKVETPIGTYNPDWAIVKHEDDMLYLVRETKSTKDRNKLRPSEKDKIACGKAHFKALEVDFKVITNILEI